MGKLRFTLTYLLFWFAIIFSCLLAENFSLFTNDHMGGMELGSLYLLSFFTILLLVFYYVLERKYNRIKLDTVLLCVILTFGLISVLTVCFQGTRTFADGINGVLFGMRFTEESEEPIAVVPCLVFVIADKPQFPSKKTVNKGDRQSDQKQKNMTDITNTHPLQFLEKGFFHTDTSSSEYIGQAFSQAVVVKHA